MRRVAMLTLSMAVAICVALGAIDVVVPPPHIDDALAKVPGRQTAVLAGGCFWGVQWVFQHVRGVSRVTSGYAGGDQASAKYGEVETGKTGHAESVQIEYDPSKVTYGQLLWLFFAVAHDPTQLNRQGPDIGKQYRSAIFISTESQSRIATEYIDQLSKGKIFARPVVTEIAKLQRFFPAEAFHQDYAARHPDDPYIRINDAPKLALLKKDFPQFFVSRKP